MALVYADRVQEESTTTGTETLDLDGATTGFRTFVSGIATTNTCVYLIEDADGSSWEVGIGTVTDATPDTLSRTTILSNDNGDTSAITLSSGTHTVSCVNPALHIDHNRKHLTGHIQGLKITQASASSITIGEGQCEIESDGNLLQLTSAHTESGLTSLSADTWYYVYVYDNSGTFTVDVSTTAPGAEYAGTARSKSAATGRRFIGCIETDGSGDIIDNNYGIEPGGTAQRIEFPDPGVNRRYLSTGSATAFVSGNADFSSFVPSGVRCGRILVVIVCLSDHATNPNQSRIANNNTATASLYQRNVGNALSTQAAIGNTEMEIDSETHTHMYKNVVISGGTGTTTLDLAMMTIER